MTLLSVVIPTCDRPALLQRAVASVMEQAVPEGFALDLTVVNDGTPGALPALPDGVPLAVVETGGRTGPAHARNEGIRASRGEWVLFLDDDDAFEPGKVARIVPTLAGADLVVHGATIELSREGITYQTRPQPRDDWYRALLVRNVVGGTPMVACRRSCLIEAGGFREDLGALEDYELWIRLARAGVRITVVPEPLTRCEYVTENRSVSKHIANHHRALEAIRETYRADYASFTPQQWRDHTTWVESMLAYKHVLNNQRRDAARSYLQALQASRAPRYLVMSLLALSWPRGLYRLRSLLA